MTVNVRVLPSGHEFSAEESDTVLRAALRGGVSLGYGCSGGNCGECKARLVSGQVELIQHHDFRIGEAEKNAGYVLLCCNRALTDLVIEAPVAGGAEDIPVKRIDARVKTKERIGDEWLVLHLQTPRTNRLRFLAGQSATLRVGEMGASYALAGCPCQDRDLQFHVRRVPADPFSEYVFDRLRPGDSVNVEGPEGRFTLREPLVRPLVFLVCHGGFAPTKSLIEHAIALESPVPMHLYWAAGDERDLYLSNLCRSWVDAIDEFHFTPVLASAGQDPVSGELPLLQKMIDFHPGLKGSDVYVVGPPAFAALTEAVLRRAGVPPGQLSIYGIS